MNKFNPSPVPAKTWVDSMSRTGYTGFIFSGAEKEGEEREKRAERRQRTEKKKERVSGLIMTQLQSHQ